MKRSMLFGGIAIGFVLLSIGLTTYSQEFFLMRRKMRDDNSLSSDDKFLEMVRTYASMHRVTEKPYLMHLEVSVRCDFRIPEPGVTVPPDQFKSSVHGDRYCDVFVSDTARDPIEKANNAYPGESVIIKVKYPNDQREKIELFTVMRKREAGYYPDHGDWEFSVVDGEAKRVLSRGRLESCTDCHDAYRDTGFVTRVYLKAAEDRSRP